MFRFRQELIGALTRNLARLSIFSRLALGYLTIIALVVGVNFYILDQIQTLRKLGTELVTHHYPAVETSKRLLASLNLQLKSDKQYWVLRDTGLLKEFLQEAGEFRKTLSTLETEETSEDGKKFLQDTMGLHEQFQDMFWSEGVERAGRLTHSTAQYEEERDALLEQITEKIQAYIVLHEKRIKAVQSDSHKRAEQAETIIQQLMVMALLLGMGLAGIASYSILRPLRRVQSRIRQIGQGQFGVSAQDEVPKELQELVVTVNWMRERLQELDQMKAEFLANVSHELRTPLTSIREGTKLLLDQIPGPLTQNQRETLRILLESSQRLNRLIASLLDLSRMEANEMTYRFAPTDINELVKTSVDKVRLLADRKDIQIVTEGVTHGARFWEVDSSRIEQVLENLLSNALKFSSEGSSICVRIEETKEKGLHLLVEDTGPGIPPEALPHIFERFYQVKTVDGRPQVGSGIGLALAKKVVEAHGGKIWAESVVGKGTSVQFLLPVQSGSEAMA